MLEMHAGEMTQLQELNLAQQDKIRSLTLHSSTLEEKARLGIHVEQTQLREENATL